MNKFLHVLWNLFFGALHIISIVILIALFLFGAYNCYISAHFYNLGEYDRALYNLVLGLFIGKLINNRYIYSRNK